MWIQGVIICCDGPHIAAAETGSLSALPCLAPLRSRVWSTRRLFWGQLAPYWVRRTAGRAAPSLPSLGRCTWDTAQSPPPQTRSDFAGENAANSPNSPSRYIAIYLRFIERERKSKETAERERERREREKGKIRPYMYSLAVTPSGRIESGKERGGESCASTR